MYGQHEGSLLFTRGAGGTSGEGSCTLGIKKGCGRSPAHTQMLPSVSLISCPGHPPGLKHGEGDVALAPKAKEEPRLNKPNPPAPRNSGGRVSGRNDVERGHPPLTLASLSLVSQNVKWHYCNRKAQGWTETLSHGWRRGEVSQATFIPRMKAANYPTP